MTSLDIIIPVYNSANYLGQLLDDIIKLECLKDFDYKIILINDGSQDETLKVCNSYSMDNRRVISIDLMRNYGQHAAIFAGLSISNSDLIITMDDDGQHPASSIPVLLTNFGEKTDLLYGVSDIEEHSYFRNLFSRMYKFMIYRTLGVRHATTISAFRLFRSSVIKQQNFESLNSAILDVVLQWNTTRINHIKVPMIKRLEGKSNYSYLKLIKLSIKAITGYSIRPLRIASVLGLITFGVSSLMFFFILWRYFLGDIAVPGFATVVLLVTLIGSVQLVTLGIFGEYLGSLHQKSLGKTHFLIRGVNSGFIGENSNSDPLN